MLGNKDGLKRIVVRPDVYEELKHRGFAVESLNTVIKRLLSETHCSYCEVMNEKK